MRRAFIIGSAVALSAMALPSAFAAGDEAGFNAAYAAAEAADGQAHARKNQWTTAVKALDDSKKLAAAGDFDKATALARESEALSKASIEQSKREDSDWTAAEIR